MASALKETLSPVERLPLGGTDVVTEPLADLAWLRLRLRRLLWPLLVVAPPPPPAAAAPTTTSSSRRKRLAVAVAASGRLETLLLALTPVALNKERN